MIDSRSFRSHRRIYKTLLLIYPPSFRRGYGELMSQAFCDRLREKGGARTWLLVGPDIVRSFPLQIMEVSLMSQKWLGVLVFLAAIALIVAMAIGVGPPLVVLGAIIVVVGGLVVTSATRSDRPTEYLYGGSAPRPWTWWTVLSALLASAYVLAAAGQLIDTPKATNVGALAIAFGFAGLIAFGLVLRARSRVVGNWMVIFATIPALTFFWFIVPALVALAIIVGAVREIARAAPQAPAAA